MSDNKFKVETEFTEEGFFVNVNFRDALFSTKIDITPSEDTFINDCITYGISSRIKMALRVISKTDENEPEAKLQRILDALKEKQLLLRAANTEAKVKLTKSTIAYIKVLGKDPENEEDVLDVVNYLNTLSKEEKKELLNSNEVKIQVTKDKLAELESS